MKKVILSTAIGFLVGFGVMYTISYYHRSADLNHDGKVDIFDISIIARKVKV